VCGDTFDITAHSYDNAKNGCRNCKSIKARSQKGQPRTTPSNTNNSAPRSRSARGRDRARSPQLARRKDWTNIRDLPTFTEYLKTENNAYSNFMLHKLKNPTPRSTGTQVHHIIPKHAGGPPNAGWNLITLTKEEHVKAHILRYEAYGEFGDYNFLHTTGVLGDRVSRNPGFDEMIRQNRQRGSRTQIQSQTGIFTPGASADAGRRSAEVLRNLTPEQRRTLDQRHRSQMSEKVYEALYKGSVYKHRKTGIIVTLSPQQALTLTKLKDMLWAALPEDHPGRKQLDTTGRSHNNVTSIISKMIQGTRPSAFGWVLVKVGVDSSSS
jgi:hypothetical protein